MQPSRVPVVVTPPAPFVVVPRRAARRVLAVAAAALVVAGSSVTGLVGAAPRASAAGNGNSAAHAVGEITETYVDTHRDTQAWGPEPRLPSRTLVTTVLYPATGTPAPDPVSGAPPDTAGGPFPLVVFGHGLGSTPQAYLHLLSAWAAAGYVVAAPRFPLSSSQTPGGPDAADVVHQPGDMRYVVDAVLRQSAGGSGPLAGLVDPHEVGAAGHSNGAISTLGLVADTCCKDARIKAAVVMAGTTEGFPGGHYELDHSPPLLLVHDTTDEVVPYRSAVVEYDRARGPKALLTIRGSTNRALSGASAHTAAAGVGGPASATVIRTTTDFFDAYLRHDQAARRRIGPAGRSRYTTMHYDAAPGGTARLPVPHQPAVHLRATVTPHAGLSDGQTVTVRWSGYTAGKVVNVLECSHVDFSTASSAGCDLADAKILQPDPAGHGSLAMRVVRGAVGDGTCDAAHPGCRIVVNNASSTDPADSVEVPISFST